MTALAIEPRTLTDYARALIASQPDATAEELADELLSQAPDDLRAELARRGALDAIRSVTAFRTVRAAARAPQPSWFQTRVLQDSLERVRIETGKRLVDCDADDLDESAAYSERQAEGHLRSARAKRRLADEIRARQAASVRDLPLDIVRAAVADMSETEADR